MVLGLEVVSRDVLVIDGLFPKYASNGVVKLRSALDMNLPIAQISAEQRQILAEAEIREDERLGLPNTVVVRGFDYYPHGNALGKHFALEAGMLNTHALLMNDSVWKLQYPNGEVVWLNKAQDDYGVKILSREWHKAAQAGAEVTNVSVSVVGLGDQGIRMAEYTLGWGPLSRKMDTARLTTVIKSNLNISGGVNSLQAPGLIFDHRVDEVQIRWMNIDDDGAVHDRLFAGEINFQSGQNLPINPSPDGNVVTMAATFGLLPWA